MVKPIKGRCLALAEDSVLSFLVGWFGLHSQLKSKAPFTISSYALRTQEWSNLARDGVSRLRKTPPLVSFLVGWLVVGKDHITRDR
jgi:hypothetical protein